MLGLYDVAIRNSTQRSPCFADGSPSVAVREFDYLIGTEFLALAEATERAMQTCEDRWRAQPRARGCRQAPAGVVVTGEEKRGERSKAQRCHNFLARFSALGLKQTTYRDFGSSPWDVGPFEPNVRRGFFKESMSAFLANC